MTFLSYMDRDWIFVYGGIQFDSEKIKSMVSSLVRDGDFMTALCGAAQGGSLEIFNELMLHDHVRTRLINCNYNGVSLLLTCNEFQGKRYRNYNAIPKYLISSPHYKNTGKKYGGESMLHYAARFDNLEMFKLLWQHPEINIDDKQGYSSFPKTAVDLARYCGSDEVYAWANSPEAVEMKLTKMSLNKQ